MAEPDRDKKKDDSLIGCVPAILFLIAMLYIGYSIHDFQKKCRAAGGISGIFVCYRPEALMPVPGWERNK